MVGKTSVALVDIAFCDLQSGNVVNGAIGKQMVDTFFESSANFEASAARNSCLNRPRCRPVCVV